MLSLCHYIAAVSVYRTLNDGYFKGQTVVVLRAFKSSGHHTLRILVRNVSTLCRMDDYNKKAG